MSKPIKNLYLVVGRTASGKDTLVDKLCTQLNKTAVRSYTTRNKREGEGDTHIFISPAEVEKYKDQMAAYTKIGEHEYFTTIEQLKSCDFYIIDPLGITVLTKILPSLKQEWRDNFADVCLKILYIYVRPNIQEIRALARGDEPKTFKRRRASEEQQFADFEAEYQVFTPNSKCAVLNSSHSIDFNILQVTHYIQTIENNC